MNSNSINPSRQVNDISWCINIIYNSMIVISTLMIIASIITAIGAVVWLHNLSTPHKSAYNIGADIGLIGGIITIVLGIASISLLICRVILQKQLKNHAFYPIKRAVSLILFIVSWLPPLIVILIELFRFL